MLARVRGELAAQGVAVVAISVDEEAADAQRFLADAGVDLTSLHGGPALAEAIGESRVPTTLLLDAAGNVVVTLAGELDEPMLRAAVARRLR